jgi:hypothetical protein
VSLQDRVDRLLSLLDANPTEHDLLTGGITASAAVTSTPGLSSVYHIRLDSGLEAFHKPFAGVLAANAAVYDQTPDDVPMNECAAWLLARELGPPFDALVPTSVLRAINGQLGSLCSRQYGVPHDTAPLADQALVLSAGFFDALIAQQDRHLGNFRWDAGRNALGLIDHGYAFARPGDLFHASAFLIVRHTRGWSKLVASEITLLQRLIASGDLVGLQGVLPSDRAAALEARVSEMLTTQAVLPVPLTGRWP